VFFFFEQEKKRKEGGKVFKRIFLGEKIDPSPPYCEGGKKKSKIAIFKK
jgi:hypothetical protein